MITLVEGALGSGKTYYVVHEVLTKYFQFNETEIKWEIKPDEDVEIYSNVDGFNLSRDLMEVVGKAGGLNPFFTVEYQKEFARSKKHVYIIDEAQRPDFFHRKYYDAHVFFFFQYLRHLGIDVYLITQDVFQLAKELQTLNEYHIRVSRRSYAYAKEFRYHFMVGKEIFRRKYLKPNLKVFSAYRSSSVVGGGHETKKFAMKYYVYVGVFACIAVFGFFRFIKYFLPSSSKNLAVAKTLGSFKGGFKIVAISGDLVYLQSPDRKLVKVNYSNVVGVLKIGSLVSLKS